MAEIEMQDPLSTEIKSSTVAGIVEALNRISKGLGMSTEPLVKASMTPVLGLDLEDPRRIYQVADGNRLWVSSPEPQIYVNNSPITADDKEFTIDFIGGSITFDGEYRPEEGDSVSVSCSHIYAAPQTSGGCEIIITFSPGFSGRSYSVTSKKGEMYTGTVPASLTDTVRVKYVSTEYTISSTDSAGRQHSTTVTTGEYYGQVEATLNSFSATIVVNTEPTASVTVAGDGATYYDTANESGKATLVVAEEGNHSVTSTFKNANSNTTTVNVLSDGETYTTTVSFITLTVTVDSGSTVTVKNGDTTLTETASSGTAKFWLPNTGTWNVTATLEDQETTGSIECSAYQGYSIKLGYIPDTLEECTWQQISSLSSSGNISDYFDVGDTKNVLINGTISGYGVSNLTVSAFIVGINHNVSREGNNLTHFQIGKIYGTLVGIIDKTDGSGKSFAMNSSSTSVGGWSSSNMRTNVLGNSSTPQAPSGNSFLNALPSEVRDVMKACRKYTYNSSSVSETSDYLSLMSEFEVFGQRKNADTNEQNYQSQYDYYRTGNSKTMYAHNSTGTQIQWWLRSPSTQSKYFCLVSTTGNINTFLAAYSYGCSPIFFV